MLPVNKTYDLAQNPSGQLKVQLLVVERLTQDYLFGELSENRVLAEWLARSNGNP
ncbi:hypothetical protein SDC9_110893 [bioreactor metagenome]|uniref:Uncharacterized protein n=1 Tax=bioreactor metagenome TaxID=1076179 RepID=A0A645BG11_9ZZZZ